MMTMMMMMMMLYFVSQKVYFLIGSNFVTHKPFR